MTSTPYRQHISTPYNSELENVRQRVLAMGGLVEQQIVDATRALTEGDGVLGDEVSRNDVRVNQLEVSIDEECSGILARRQPTAGDLRLVYAVIKTITDLERIGDEAERIARMASDLASQERIGQPLIDVAHLSRARLANGARCPRRLCPHGCGRSPRRRARRDSAVDREYEALMRQCITFMMEDPRTIRRVPSTSHLVRARARAHWRPCAQHRREYVIYFVKGKDVRHIGLEAMEREVRGG